MTSGASKPPAFSSSPKIHASDTPFRNASKLERWIVMPSAIGSENGIPTSTTSPTDATDFSVLMKSFGSG
jgi:hypothetical protein